MPLSSASTEQLVCTAPAWESTKVTGPEPWPRGPARACQGNRDARKSKRQAEGRAPTARGSRAEGRGFLESETFESPAEGVAWGLEGKGFGQRPRGPARKAWALWGILSSTTAVRGCRGMRREKQPEAG